MKVYRHPQRDETSPRLEIVSPDGTIAPAKHRSLGATIATTQQIAQRDKTSPGERGLTWVIREAEDEAQTAVAKIIRTPNGVIETWTPLVDWRVSSSSMASAAAR